jgi:putative endonuclease
MSEKTYCVYIVASRSRNLYTGITNDLERRIYEHKKGKVPGFTKKYRVNRLVYFEVFRDVGAAIVREKHVKSWTRARRIALIESKNPTWDDLAENWARRWDRVERRMKAAEERKRSADPSSAPKMADSG